MEVGVVNSHLGKKKMDGLYFEWLSGSEASSWILAIFLFLMVFFLKDLSWICGGTKSNFLGLSYFLGVLLVGVFVCFIKMIVSFSYKSKIKILQWGQRKALWVGGVTTGLGTVNWSNSQSKDDELEQLGWAGIKGQIDMPHRVPSSCRGTVLKRTVCWEWAGGGEAKSSATVNLLLLVDTSGVCAEVFQVNQFCLSIFNYLWSAMNFGAHLAWQNMLTED